MLYAIYRILWYMKGGAGGAGGLVPPRVRHPGEANRPPRGYGLQQIARRCRSTPDADCFNSRNAPLAPLAIFERMGAKSTFQNDARGGPAHANSTRQCPMLTACYKL